MAATRRTAIRTLTINFAGRDQQVTAIPMTDRDLTDHADDIDTLDLPTDRSGYGFNALKGWNLYDAQGEHFGRVFSRGTAMTAEWYDNIDQQEWLLAEWGCRRLERAAYQIFLLRDQMVREYSLASEARSTTRQAEEAPQYWTAHDLAA